MQKKLTVLFMFAMFVLVVGWAITPAQAHCSGDPNHNAKHKTDRMPRKQCNLPVKVRCGELTVHPASEDPVLRGDSQG